MVEFASRLVNRFEVSPRGAHVGVITFNEHPHIAFSFNTLEGFRQIGYEVQRLIHALPYKPGYTRIDRALQLANSYLFTAKGGARKEAAKVR